MNATFVNGWWMTTNQGGTMGTTNTSGITDKQRYNAHKIYNYFNNLGWSLSAIAGMIGNMQLESWLSPALVENTHRSQFPNSAANLSDVPNSVALEHYDHNNHSASGYGLGLAQWDGYTPTSPAGHKLVSFAIRYNMNWYDGDTQVFRIRREQETDIQWSPATLGGIYWTWSNYPTNTETPEQSAYIWRVCYEVAAAGTDSTRQANARYWYDYFASGPTPPTPPTPTTDWVTGQYFASLAVAYDPDITGQDIPYSQWDCIGYVNHVWQDVPVVRDNNYSLPNGTNTLWRRNMAGYPTQTYSTTSPSGQNPTPVLWWKGTVTECQNQFGEIPTGALLFHQISEAGPPPIPSQYEGDGIGNFAHVGIYIGNNQVMQSGGMDSGSVPGGGVHRSAYNPNAWNYVAFVCYVNPLGTFSGVPVWLLMRWAKKKGDIKNVRKTI